MSKTRATQAADIYSTARENPYVQRLIEDDELRDNLRNAFDAARKAYGRATGNGKGPGQGDDQRQEGAKGHALGG